MKDMWKGVAIAGIWLGMAYLLKGANLDAKTWDGMFFGPAIATIFIALKG